MAFLAGTADETIGQLSEFGLTCKGRRDMKKEGYFSRFLPEPASF